MKLDVQMAVPQSRVAESARRYEEAGYAGIWTSETVNDPFLSVLLAAQATAVAQVGTSIAVAFARNPMTVATSANDLQALSEGRFVLGLGTQVRAHIVNRFSMPWSKPAARFREFVLALRAIWATWNEGVPLHFEGEFYRHTLTTPFFQPRPNPFGLPQVVLAGVGPRMTEVAGEVADGFTCHALTTERYLREVTIPSLERGRARTGATLKGFEISAPCFVVTATDEVSFEEAARKTKNQIAFYASTPAYRGVLDLHGWGWLQPELHEMARRGQWKAMGERITDEMLESIAVIAPPAGIAPALEKRFGGAVQRTSLYLTYDSDPLTWASVARALDS